MSQSSPGHAEPTGDPDVDAVVSRLDELEGLDLPAQLEVFGELQASLATILDTQPEPDPHHVRDHATVPDPATLPDDAALPAS